MTEALALRALACATKAKRGVLRDGDLRGLFRDVLVQAPHDPDWQAVALAFDGDVRVDMQAAGRMLDDWLRAKSIRLRLAGERLEAVLDRLAVQEADREPDEPEGPIVLQQLLGRDEGEAYQAVVKAWGRDG